MKYLVIKRGEYGILFFEKDKIFSLPAYPLEVVKDPTGAGDSFAGGFMGYLSKLDKMDEPSFEKICSYRNNDGLDKCRGFLV